MKSLTEILAKVSESHTVLDTVTDFHFDSLLQFIPFKKAKRFLKKETTAEEFEEYYRPLNEGNIIGVMEQYMKFAWEMCLDRHMISARSTIAHYHAWLWIIDDDKTLEFLKDDNNFACFGAPILKCICDRYQWYYKDFIENWRLETTIEFIKGIGCDTPKIGADQYTRGKPYRINEDC